MPLSICDNMVPFMFPYPKRSGRRQRSYRSQMRSRTFTQIVVRYVEGDRKKSLLPFFGGFNQQPKALNDYFVTSNLICLSFRIKMTCTTNFVVISQKL